MPYRLFHDLLPEIAEEETRTIIVPPGIKSPLPPGDYAFCEMFCDEPGCDCRRVFFSVASSQLKMITACIAYGWEPPAFYAKWMRDDDPKIIADLKGPVLNMGSPQSRLAPIILELFKAELLPNKAYMERVKRHYTMFRQRIDGKTKVS